MTNENKFLKAYLDRFENDLAVIILADKQKIIIPKQYLDKNIKEGAELLIEIKSIEKQEQSNRDIAKSLLNEILSNQTE